MRRTAFAILTVAFLFILTAFPAVAASPHFKRGGEPTCTITGSTTSKSTTCTATLAGLGGGNLDISTTVRGSAVYQCQNPGGNLSPGQNRVLVGPVTAPTTIPSEAIKNGNVTFTTNPAVLTAPATVTGAEAGCPNPQWTGVNPNLRVENITLTISQGGVLLFTCTASNSEGLSGTVALAC
jgi:hypothetical protein